MLYSVEIGNNIITIRKSRHISQKELAAKACMSTSRLRDVEHGKANYSLNMLERIANALNVHPLALLLLSANQK